MPVINVEDLTDKDKAVMEVTQLKVEVKLERWLVSGSSGDTNLNYEDSRAKKPVVRSRRRATLSLTTCV